MWFENITLLDLSVKGLMVGIVASAPMGPVGVLCIQRTLNKGRWYGLVTGLGAALSDITYALITGLGMSFVLEFIEQPRTLYVLQLVGSVILFLFGYFTFRSKPHLRQVSREKGTLTYNGITGFLVTLSNPLIIFLFLALFARFTFVVPEHLGQQVLGYISIFLGAMLWWYGLTYVVDKLRATFEIERISLINRIIGVIVMTVSVLGLFSTLLGLTLY
ncbi:MAG: LysE family transporter [Bacteroidaceae bacterium]|nr:LysE family transporter [Bacteroidaceae bacterium]